MHLDFFWHSVVSLVRRLRLLVSVVHRYNFGVSVQVKLLSEVEGAHVRCVQAQSP